MPQAAPTGNLLRRVWGELRKTLGTEGVLPFTPIWNNPRYVELQDFSGFTTWKKKGIWFFSQLYEDGVLKTYEQLCREYQLAPRGFYQYLQLRHALQKQQQTRSLVVTSPSPLTTAVLQAEARRGLIKIYEGLLTIHASLRSPRKWVEDIVDVD